MAPRTVSHWSVRILAEASWLGVQPPSCVMQLQPPQPLVLCARRDHNWPSVKTPNPVFTLLWRCCPPLSWWQFPPALLHTPSAGVLKGNVSHLHQTGKLFTSLLVREARSSTFKSSASFILRSGGQERFCILLGDFYSNNSNISNIAKSPIRTTTTISKQSQGISTSFFFV